MFNEMFNELSYIDTKESILQDLYRLKMLVSHIPGFQTQGSKDSSVLISPLQDSIRSLQGMNVFPLK